MGCTCCECVDTSLYGHLAACPFGQIDRLRAELAECKKDAERYRWLRENVTYHDIDHDYDVEIRNVPVLAQVSNRLWYHATDDVTSETLDDLIDAARKGEGE